MNKEKRVVLEIGHVNITKRMITCPIVTYVKEKIIDAFFYVFCTQKVDYLCHVTTILKAMIPLS